MNHSMYVVPALVSVGVHLIVLFASPKTIKPPSPTQGPIVLSTPDKPFFEEPEKPDTKESDLYTPATAPLGSNRPEGEDLVGILTPDVFQIPVSTSLPNPRDMVEKAVFIGPKGEPGGSPDLIGVTTDFSGVCSATLLDNAPNTRFRCQPKYPAEARRNGLNGEVLVDFVVDENGLVRDPRVLRSSNASFDDPALQAVARWRFEPGRRQGKPVSFRMRVPIRFQIDSV